MQISAVNFVLGATSIKQVPKEGIPQLAFLGRSNSGKSSLLNALFEKKIVKTSNKPGKTREINFFLVQNSQNSSFYFVDLPGVGYAKVSKTMRDDMADRIKNYVERAHDLKGVVYLLDIRHGGHQIDFETLNGIKSAGVPILLVASKADKLNRSEFIAAKKKFMENFHLPEAPLAISSRTKKGLPEFWKEIDMLLGIADAASEACNG
ncbi:MAG: ribosome biogenesis GTP-binding protein YihA/YsxC [Fibromonadaceae bacterium]|jgi:GTP-binding protein|nr:ribosome biogenesis GTP-binding protein YihA/YsxC [Fibromonadaceae bacterium]